MATDIHEAAAREWRARYESVLNDAQHYGRERDALRARVAELEAALVESNKITYTPKQQGEIARRALEKKGKGAD